MAAATSWLDELLDESDVELPDELDDEEDVPEVALVLELLSPVTPICDSASMMELASPPPGGGGGGGGASELTSEVLEEPDCTALVLLVPDSCASQLFMLEMLLIVMSLTPWG